MTLPTQLAKAAEAAAKSEILGAQTCRPGQDMFSRMFERGVKWLYAHLTAEAGAFDEAAARAALSPELFQACLDDDVLFMEGARWQHQQSSAREAALGANTTRLLKDAAFEHQKHIELFKRTEDVLREEVTRLRADLRTQAQNMITLETLNLDLQADLEEAREAYRALKRIDDKLLRERQ